MFKLLNNSKGKLNYSPLFFKTNQRETETVDYIISLLFLNCSLVSRCVKKVKRGIEETALL